jgi:hypothetical protein
VDTDEKSPYILHSEVEKVIKQKMHKKATDDNVPGDVFKLLPHDHQMLIHMFSSCCEHSCTS